MDNKYLYIFNNIYKITEDFSLEILSIVIISSNLDEAKNRIEKYREKVSKSMEGEERKFKYPPIPTPDLSVQVPCSTKEDLFVIHNEDSHRTQGKWLSFDIFQKYESSSIR